MPASAGSSPALQLVVFRLPAKRCALSVSSPGLAAAPSKSRACGGQIAHAPSRRRAVCADNLVTRVTACGVSAARKAVRPVCLFTQPRTHAVFSACGPAHGSCWPRPAGGRFACLLLYHRQLPKRKENAGNSKGVYKKERFSSFFALIRVVLLQVDIIFKSGGWTRGEELCGELWKTRLKMWKTTAEGQPFSTHHKGWNRGHKVYVNKKSCTICNGMRRFTSLRPFDRIKKDRIAGPRHKHKPCAGLRKQRPGAGPRKQKPSAGTHPEQTAGVRDTGKKKTRCASCSAQPRG